MGVKNAEVDNTKNLDETRVNKRWTKQTKPYNLRDISIERQ